MLPAPVRVLLVFAVLPAPLADEPQADTRATKAAVAEIRIDESGSSHHRRSRVRSTRGNANTVLGQRSECGEAPVKMVFC